MRIGRGPRTREAYALKLTKIGKEAVINISSRNADKIQCAFEEVSNYTGINMDGGFAHCIKRALDTGSITPSTTRLHSTHASV